MPKKNETHNSMAIGGGGRKTEVGLYGRILNRCLPEIYYFILILYG